MKANELMIGDWVMLSDCKIPIRMEDVSGSQLFKRWADNGDTCIHFSYTEIEPIPLTEEILKANEFRTEEFEYGEVGWFPKQGCTYLTQYPHQNPMFALEGTDIELEYVHQLQHALRLCGLTELADNFRIG